MTQSIGLILTIFKTYIFYCYIIQREEKYIRFETIKLYQRIKDF